MVIVVMQMVEGRDRGVRLLGFCDQVELVCLVC